MKIGAVLFVLLFTLQSHAKTCVLSLYGPKDKETAMFDKVFGYDPRVDYFRGAQIEDIRRCFESDYSDIVWLSHGLSLRNGVSNYSAPLLTDPDGKRFPLLIRFFENLNAKINYSQLKKVRIMVCNVDYSGISQEIHSTIDLLIRDLKKHQVTVDISPIFILGKWATGENVTRVDYHWLAADLDRSRLTKWQAHLNPYCEDDYTLGCDRNTAIWVVPLAPMLP